MRNAISTARDLRRREAYGRLAAIDARRLWAQGCSLYLIAGRADTTIPFVRRWLKEGAPPNPGLDGARETRAEFNSEVSATIYRRREAYQRLTEIDAHLLRAAGHGIEFIAGRAATTPYTVRRWLKEVAASRESVATEDLARPASDPNAAD